jgi:hypothetical protein
MKDCFRRKLEVYQRLLTGYTVEFQNAAIRQYPVTLHCRFTFRSIPDFQLTIIALTTSAVTKSGWAVKRDWDS